MSDFRRFCITYALAKAILFVIEWIGDVDHVDTALMLARFFLAFSVAATVVAIWPGRGGRA